MLSYQHIYHAGNIVDCQKHSILCAFLDELRQSPLPFTYLDTHSGRGIYDLDAPEAQKIQEYRDGIDQIWPLQKWPVETILYQKALENLNPNGVVNSYPGSAYLAASTLRYYDRAVLYELHPQEHYALCHTMERFGNVDVYQNDGWAALKSLPSVEGNRLVFIDPSYELKEEYQTLVLHALAALRRWPDATFMIWYPMLAAKRHEQMLQDFKQSGIPHILRNEIHVKPPESGGLYGTGLLIINPTADFDKKVETISQWLTAAIGIGQTTEWLVA